MKIMICEYVIVISSTPELSWQQKIYLLLARSHLLECGLEWLICGQNLVCAPPQNGIRISLWNYIFSHYNVRWTAPFILVEIGSRNSKKHVRVSFYSTCWCNKVGKKENCYMLPSLTFWILKKEGRFSEKSVQKRKKKSL